MRNQYLEIQYKLHIESIDLFLSAIRAAAAKDDQIVDREEAKQLKAIEKKCAGLKALLQKYVNESAAHEQ